MMSPLNILAVSLLALSQTLAAPVHHWQRACDSTNATDLGADILGVQFALSQINTVSGVNDPAPVFHAQLSLLDAKNVANNISSFALFPTFEKPPTASMIALLMSSLQDAQSNVSTITPAAFTSTIANTTQFLAKANQSLADAMSVAQSLDCTAA
ncbi:hypothetical protein B0H11DRAFT_2189853 [Mycena galericulata]|nr:hypothetical protein B0H11DRAFT_2189853 [Mycena galericulata]